MPLGEKTKELWKDPNYRKMMSEAHKGNIPWNKGKKCPQISKPKKGIRTSISTEFKKNHKVPDEWREIFRLNASKPEVIERLKKTAIKKGEHFSPETEFKKGVIISLEYCFKKGHIPWNKGIPHSEETKQKLREARLHQVFPVKDSRIERIIQKELKKRNIQFTKHYPIKGQPDIAFPEEKLVIFLDGDYWHTLPKQIERDKGVTEHLINNGWTVLRYWEHNIMNDPSRVVDDILNRRWRK